MKKLLILLIALIAVQFDISAATRVRLGTETTALPKKKPYFRKQDPVVRGVFLELAAKKMINLMKDYPYPDVALDLLYLILQNVLFPEIDFMWTVISQHSPEMFADSYKNRILLYYAFRDIIVNHLSKDQALKKSENDLKIGKYPYTFEAKPIMHDVTLYTSAIDMERILASLSDIQNEFRLFCQSIPDYTQALPNPDKRLNQKVLYGVHSTRQNYACGVYIAPNGKGFPIQRVSPALSPWGIFGVPPGDNEALEKKVHEDVSKIERRYPETAIEIFNGTCQDAVIKLGAKNSVALLSFAHATKVGGGTYEVKLGQEELNIHTIAGLFESLAALAAPPEKLTYKDSLHSPESVLYTTGATLIKRFQKGVVLAADQPIVLDVISCAGIPIGVLNPKYPDLYKEIDRRIGLVFAMAIVNGCEILILGKYNLGKLNGDPNKITAIIKKYINKYQGYFESIVLAAGDYEPYA
ncbi:MAG: DUF2263 domain-containing protein [Holosporales bacterium]|jgi:uncharacterized protein (TIGR02452 family)|nr:DUF2263 domain-containing protein [Holosporales bacterium]